DARADAAVGRRTLAVRIDPHGARRLYRTLNLAALAAIVILAERGAVPVWGLALPALLTLVAMLAARGIDTAPGKKRRLKRVIEITLAIHVLGGLWLAAAVWSG
ncbi:MAG: prenyltransferase, partial [Alphaproteobacteria bacterium]